MEEILNSEVMNRAVKIMEKQMMFERVLGIIVGLFVLVYGIAIIITIINNNKR